MSIKIHSFVKRKYNQEFLIDCVYFSVPDRPVIIGKPFCYDFHGIFIQNEGSVKISIDNAIYQLRKGAFIFLRANQVREYIAVTPDFSGYLLIFENEFIETFFQDNLFIHRFQFFHTNQPPVLSCNEPVLLEHTHICEKIRTELSHLQDDSHHYIRSLLYNALIQINRLYIKEYNLSIKLYQEDISLRFIKALEANIRHKLSVEDYANLLNIGRNQFNKVIRKTSGKFPSAIIRERLLTEIKRDLLYSDKNISEIAYELGFSDHSNFVRFYKTHTGLTPTRFRSGRAK